MPGDKVLLKKRICLTSFVFGEKYQDYIPLFIFSIFKAYPDYAIIIFLHEPLKEYVKIQLNHLKSLGDYKIIENYQADINFCNSPFHGAALRWVLWDDAFNDFEYIYIADIDIFYCKEELSLLEQHLIHCKTINKPFSNIQRQPITVNPFNLKNLFWTYKKTSFKYMFKSSLSSSFTAKRLSGLHFIMTKEYYVKVKPLIKKYERKICNFEYFSHHPHGFNDESLLYDIINEAGLSHSLPIMTNDSEILTNLPNQLVFRPHHGIHLGIFRETEYPVYQKMTLSTDIYLKYYIQFCKLEKDEIYQKLFPFFSKQMKNDIQNLHEYYKK